MLECAWQIARDPNVQVVVTMDGFGSPALKQAQYRSYVHDEGVGYSGIKLVWEAEDQALDAIPTPAHVSVAEYGGSAS